MLQTIGLLISIVFCGTYYSSFIDLPSATEDLNPPYIEVLKIKPSTTDATIITANDPHLIMYDTSMTQGKLFLFLPGTNGIPEKGPKQLFRTAIRQGYRVINLSYINKQAVASICKGQNLLNDSACTEKFRNQRVFGTNTTSLIPDEPQDAIINRLTKLLIHLSKTDQSGHWNTYLEKEQLSGT